MFGRKGDRNPPDQGGEQIRVPEPGFVYKLNKKGSKGFDYVLITDVIPSEQDPLGKARLKMKRWSPRKKQWVKGYFGEKILLETFLSKNDRHNYSFAFDSPRNFYEDQNIPIPERPTDPIRAFRDLGSEGLPPDKKSEEEELLLGPENQLPDEDTDAPEAEPPEPEESSTESEDEPEEGEESEPAEESDPDEAPSENPEDEPSAEETSNKPLATRENEAYLGEKERLEEVLEAARRKFVQDDYELSTKSNKLTTLLGLKPEVIPPRDTLAAKEYLEALKDLRDFEFQNLQDSLDNVPANLRQAKIESFLNRYRYEEKAALFALGKEVKSLAENENLVGKTKNFLREIGNGYRQMSFKKKIAIGAGVIGLGALSSAGASVAGLAGLAYAARRVVVGAAGYLAVDEGANAFLSKRDRKKAEEESKKIASEMLRDENIYRAEAAASGEEALPWERLMEAVNEKLKVLDKDLEKLKGRERKIKLAAFAGALGLPLAASVLDLGGSEAPVGAGNEEGAPPLSSETQGEISGNETGGNPLGPEGEGAAERTPPVTPPNPEAPNAPNTPEAPGAGGTPNPEGGTTAPTLETVTVTEADRARGLWGIIDRQLPQALPEGERNRIIAGVQNLMRQKLEGLTPAQIQEQYGLSSNDLDIIHPGETIRLNSLVSQAELQEIINNEQSASVRVSTPEAPAAAETPGREGGGTPPAESTAREAASTETPEQREAAGYINSEVIGFGSRPLTPEEQGWQEYRDVQTRAIGGPYDASKIIGEGSPDRLKDIPGYNPETGEINEAALNEYNASAPENIEHQTSSPGNYTVEMSNYRSLLQDPAFAGRDIPALQRESLGLLNQELFDMSNTEFGPDHQLTNWNRQFLERQYGGRPVSELVAFNDQRYDYDPRIDYREREWNLRRSRGIYLDPINPYPTFSDGPDANAIATMDHVRSEYRQNIGRMAEAAYQAFGPAALPQNTLEHQETVREYITRITTLYTRARLENPNFRLNF